MNRSGCRMVVCRSEERDGKLVRVREIVMSYTIEEILDSLRAQDQTIPDKVSVRIDMEPGPEPTPRGIRITWEEIVSSVGDE